MLRTVIVDLLCSSVMAKALLRLVPPFRSAIHHGESTLVVVVSKDACRSNRSAMEKSTMEKALHCFLVVDTACAVVGWITCL